MNVVEGFGLDRVWATSEHFRCWLARWDWTVDRWRYFLLISLGYLLGHDSSDKSTQTHWSVHLLGLCANGWPIG